MLQEDDLRYQARIKEISMISELYSNLRQNNEGNDVKISVVVATYNEKENLLQYVDEIMSTLGDSIDYEIIVVDDNSPDGTGKLADELSGKNNDIKVVHRPKKMGLASALVEGFRVSSGEFVLVSDADLQHSPALIKTFLDEINRGADLVIASRYIAEAETKGWSPLRKIVSRGATIVAHVFLPTIRRFRDPLSGYFMLRKEILLTNRLTGTSWKLLLEILINGGFQKVVEVPYVFRPRINGKSKLKLREFFDYLILIANLRERMGKQNIN